MAFPAKRYDTLVCSGGGIKGLLELGALWYFWERKMIDYVCLETFSGTSIGSAIVSLLVCGYTPMDIFHRVLGMEQLIQLNDTHTFWEMLSSFGLLSVDSALSIVRDMILGKFGYIPTLEQLQAITGKRLVITATNISTAKCEYMDYRSHPQLKLYDAIKLSCCIPFIFRRIKYRGHYYADGGLTDNCPIRPVDTGSNSILCMTVRGIGAGKIDTFYHYVVRLLSIPINQTEDILTESVGANCDLVRIKADSVSIVELKLPVWTKIDMFILGYATAQFTINCPQIDHRFYYLNMDQEDSESEIES